MESRKRMFKVSKQETLLLLRAYREHPARRAEILEEIMQNLQHLPDDARNLYRSSSRKQLRDRRSSKFGKLLTTKQDAIEDVEIRAEVQSIQDMERRYVCASVSSEEPENVDRREVLIDQLSDSSDDEQVPLAAGTSVDDEPGQVINDDQTQDEPPATVMPKERRPKKRPLCDLIRENQTAYNRFITKKIPKLLRQLGVSSSLDEN